MSCDRLRKCLISQLKAVSRQTMLYSMACFQNDKQKFLSHWSIALLGDKTTSVFRVFANTIDRRPLPEALSVQSVLLSFRIRSFGIFFFLFVGNILRHLQTFKILNPFPTELVDYLSSVECAVLSYTCAINAVKDFSSFRAQCRKVGN